MSNFNLIFDYLTYRTKKSKNTCRIVNAPFIFIIDHSFLTSVYLWICCEATSPGDSTTKMTQKFRAKFMVGVIFRPIFHIWREYHSFSIQVLLHQICQLHDASARKNFSLTKIFQMSRRMSLAWFSCSKTSFCCQNLSF